MGRLDPSLHCVTFGMTAAHSFNTRRQRALRARGWHYDGCRRILRSSESATRSGTLTVHKKDDTDCKSAPAGELFGTLNLSESATRSGALTTLQQTQQPTKVPLEATPSLYPVERLPKASKRIKKFFLLQMQISFY